ncbi:hypothetical protein [Pectobacterium quasiaquaticum]|uniref:hypothetical protein n=1 Tax=Pectobacterium quasiaquaticum TaxID=2774015 RepID=UPI001CF784DD|nr:hypothetical protein [Pectobacterium quasiaquaticum]
MEKINSLDAVSSRYIPANTVGKSAVDAKAVASVQENNATATNNESTQVSALARQLSDAAVRAAARDAGTDRDGLGEIARSVTEKLLGANYDMNKVAHDAEVPKTEDPDLLARAKQATSFVNGDGANPFRGMSREQLALITYDKVVISPSMKDVRPGWSLMIKSSSGSVPRSPKWMRSITVLDKSLLVHCQRLLSITNPYQQLKKHNCPKDTMRSYCLRFKLRKAVAYLRA